MEEERPQSTSLDELEEMMLLMRSIASTAPTEDLPPIGAASVAGVAEKKGKESADKISGDVEIAGKQQEEPKRFDRSGTVFGYPSLETQERSRRFCAEAILNRPQF